MNVEDFAPKFHEAYLRNIFVVMRLEKNIKSITEQIRNEQLQVNVRYSYALTNLKKTVVL